MLIRVNDPFLKRNLSRFQLSHIWDEVLQNIPAFHLKSYSAATTPHGPSPIYTLGGAHNFTLISMVLPWGSQHPSGTMSPPPFTHVSVPSMVSVVW